MIRPCGSISPAAEESSLEFDLQRAFAQARTQPARHRLRLAARVAAHELRRVALRRIMLLVARRNGVEWNTELREDHAPLR